MSSVSMSQVPGPPPDDREPFRYVGTLVPDLPSR
jgi:hypothetical protein